MQAKRQPGRPSKKHRMDEEPQKLDSAVQKEHKAWIREETRYNTAYFYAYTCKKNFIPLNPRKHRGSYTAEKRFEVLEYINATSISVRKAAKEFNMPKSTVQDLLKRDMSQVPKRGGGNKKGAGRPLSYDQAKDSTLVEWILEMRDLHLPVSIAEVKEKAKELILPDNPNFKASNWMGSEIFHPQSLHVESEKSQHLS